ncbi:MAG: PorT family protein [Flavobacteriales bacterium]|nr:PorT family protein [Flavobacteriales bacterium]
MKKLLLAFLILFSVQAKSQILISLLLGDKLNSEWMEFGLEGGLNWATESGFETNAYAQKWNMGFYFNIRVQEHWSVYTGVMVKSNLGVNKLTDTDLITLGAKKIEYPVGTEIEGDYSHKMNTFLVPILMRYNFKNHIYVAAGPQLGLAYKSWIEFESDIDGYDVAVKHYNREMINMIDAGFTVATGWRMMKGTGWTIGAKYYYGLVDVFKDIPNTKNSSFFVNLCIPIGAGDPEALKPEKKK